MGVSNQGVSYGPGQPQVPYCHCFQVSFFCYTDILIHILQTYMYTIHTYTNSCGAVPVFSTNLSLDKHPCVQHKSFSCQTYLYLAQLFLLTNIPMFSTNLSLVKHPCVQHKSFSCQTSLCLSLICLLSNIPVCSPQVFNYKENFHYEYDNLDFNGLGIPQLERLLEGHKSHDRVFAGFLLHGVGTSALVTFYICKYAKSLCSCTNFINEELVSQMLDHFCHTRISP